MEQFILLMHVLTALTLIAFVLFQQGKGAEVGASFGSGASQTVFGSQGSGSFATRTTAILVFVFFVTSLLLGKMASQKYQPRDLEDVAKKVESTIAPQSGAIKDNDIPDIKR